MRRASCRSSNSPPPDTSRQLPTEVGRQVEADACLGAGHSGDEPCIWLTSERYRFEDFFGCEPQHRVVRQSRDHQRRPVHDIAGHADEPEHERLVGPELPVNDGVGSPRLEHGHDLRVEVMGAAALVARG